MSTRRDSSGPGMDATNRRTVKNGLDSSSTHGGVSSGYDQQRRSHQPYQDYGQQSNGGDYSSYYGYGAGFGHHGGQFSHSQQQPTAVNSSMMSGGGQQQLLGYDMMNAPFDAAGPWSSMAPAVPQQQHDPSAGYYYNYFGSTTNAIDYNNWAANFAPPTNPRGGGGGNGGGHLRNSDSYYDDGGMYGGRGGVGNGGGGGSYQHLEQNMARMHVYDEQPSFGGGGGSNYSKRGGGGESKSKSWANVASQPAKSAPINPLGIGRGKKIGGMSIGGVPGSAINHKASTDSYFGGGGGIQTSPPPMMAESPAGEYWAPAANSNNFVDVSSSFPRNSAAAVGNGREKRSPRPPTTVMNSAKENSAPSGNWNNKPQPPVVTRDDHHQHHQTMTDGSEFGKRRANETTTAAANGVAVDKSIVDPPVKSSTNATATNSSSTISAADYNPKGEFVLPTAGARYFVIKSYSEDDVHRSIKYGIWCSTEHGNKRLDSAFKDRRGGPVYLLFSVNASGHFCGVAEMTSSLDYETRAGVWAQDKWKGQFMLKWIYVKDVPNQQLRHIRLENNENKPVTNSRDTQEVPPDKGRQVVRLIHEYRHSTSLFDDFAHYERRQEEESARKTNKRGGGSNVDEY